MCQPGTTDGFYYWRAKRATNKCFGTVIYPIVHYVYTLCGSVYTSPPIPLDIGESIDFSTAFFELYL